MIAPLVMRFGNLGMEYLHNWRQTMPDVVNWAVYLGQRSTKEIHSVKVPVR